jgi:hypothetical protein
VADQILNDQVLQHLSQSQTTHEHVRTRVLEICQQALLQPALSQDLQQAKSELHLAQVQNHSLQKQLRQIEQSEGHTKSERLKEREHFEKLAEDQEFRWREAESLAEKRLEQLRDVESELLQIKRLYDSLCQELHRQKAKI